MGEISNIINLLKCPECHSEIVLDIGNQRVQCKNNHHFPIQDSVISFSKDHEFDFHWEENYLEELSGKKIEIASSFLKPLLDNAQENLQILDAGCGDGVHAKVLENAIPKDCKYFGIDISSVAIGLASKRIKNPNFFFIHGDIDQLPFFSETFDITFSYGVLAYTPNPREAFKSLCGETKKGGLIGVWIYPKTKGFSGFLLNFIRKSCHKLGRKATIFVANTIVPFLGLLPTASKVNIFNSSWKQCREVVLVNIAPENIYYPEPLEIENWFRGENIEITFTDNKKLITIWGRKK